MGNAKIEVISAESDEQLTAARVLFAEYSDELRIDHCTSNIDREIRDMPGEYGPPSGKILIAFADGRPAGCVGLRKFEGDICEMKRLHVRRAFRGQGIGRMLAVAVIDAAREMGYARMRLDTVADKMVEAVKLYRSLGFGDIARYHDHPVEGTIFMELVLAGDQTAD